MRLVVAFLKLVRLPNLIFIALAQILFQFCIYHSLYKGFIPENDFIQFILLVLASLLIAAAGYIINDYFDINIDEVNKPRELVIDKVISRRWAIAWHFMLSATGLILTILALPFLQKWYLILINACSIALLWFYSTTFKRKLLIGNVVISLLTAWTILILFYSKVSFTDAFGTGNVTEHKFFRIAFLYAGFAFISSLIREAIKDMEDREGDEKYGCRTMPIVWGINATKIYVAVWMSSLIAVLIMVQVYVLQFRWWWPAGYNIVMVILPLLYSFIKLFRANSVHNFHILSRWIKLVMLTGILSMAFFYFYL
ncbi:MAG: geranylgeranylglycerol-phosphate geranylgeranyltransferase [Bacteroidetes bacterium]|nr:geranylgeranylglycerol-phosphate geranylgeranyltransferase [Bacteroidota bacterium]MBS1931810.1 geranylgeranylglycerol-phosphate geranylgeranyltransferase [Bacteroidota bacterium]